MQLSLLRDTYDTGHTAEVSWDELVSEFSAHRVTTSKESMPLFSAGVWPEHAPRKADYVSHIQLAVLDYDHLTDEQAARLWAMLEARPEAWLSYTTFSHGAVQTDPRKPHHGEVETAFRVVVPLSHPVPGNQWPDIWPRMAADWALPGDVQPDSKCKDPGRMYFVPTAHPDREDMAGTHHHPGPPLDPTRYQGGLAGQILASIAATPAPARKLYTGELSRAGLESLAAKLKRRKASTADALRNVLDGTAWAVNGSRDATLYMLAGDIARAFPGIDMRSAADYFKLSLDAVNRATPEDPMDMSLVLDKLSRRQAEVNAEIDQKTRDAAIDRGTRIRSMFQELNICRDTPYTEQELSDFTALTDTTPQEFGHRWIVLAGKAYYFFVCGRYIGPVVDKEADLAAQKYLAPAPVQLETRDRDGRKVARSIHNLAMEYGTHARRVVCDMTADVGWYDAATSTMIEATSPLRKITPRFNSEIDEWFRIMAGIKYSVLLDWIMYLLDLDRPCAALYLQGDKGAGKSLFATGVARIWTDGPPTMMEQTMGNWNDALTRCPLVFADEKLPKDARGTTRTEDLRAFIQERERPLKRRFCSDAIMRGATRTVIAANNKNLIKSTDILTPEDIGAIADRILHVHVGPESAAYLSLIDTSTWVDGDAIAAHCLWIVQHRARDPHPPRFLVSAGAEDTFTTQLATGTMIGSAVAQWLVCFLDNPHQLWTGKPPNSPARHIGWSMARDCLVVSPQVIVEYWDSYRTNIPRDRATLSAVVRALAAISTGRAPHEFGQKSKTVYHVRLSDLQQWGAEHGWSAVEIGDNAAKFKVMPQNVTSTDEKPNIFQGVTNIVR